MDSLGERGWKKMFIGGRSISAGKVIDLVYKPNQTLSISAGRAQRLRERPPIRKVPRIASAAPAPELV